MLHFARILRISMHGPSDLLSPLYDASRAQVTLVRLKSIYSFQGFLKARDTALAAAGFLFSWQIRIPLEEDHMTEGFQPKETKAQRTERLKREKNPWEAFDEVRDIRARGALECCARVGRLYFKWWGIYTQGDGVGATGGKGGEGLASDYFMMRIGIPNGIVSAASFARSADSRGNMRATWPTSPYGRTSNCIG